MKIIFPITGSPRRYPVGNLIQGFGENPQLYKQIGMKGHNGWDIIKGYGFPVLAPHDGVIANMDFQGQGYGNVIYLLSPEINGKHLLSILGHMTEDKLVKEGQQVKVGQQIGKMGNSGFVVSAGVTYWGGSNPDKKGTHLHWTPKYLRKVKPGERVNNSVSYLGTSYTTINYNNDYAGAFDPGMLLEGQPMDNEFVKTINIDGAIGFVVLADVKENLQFLSKVLQKSITINPDGTIPTDYSIKTK
jgi:murein DD-endopeptidase MepM/ murein hydrolase activator NlpD